MPRIPKQSEIARHSLPPEKSTRDFDSATSKIVTEKLTASLALLPAFFELTVAVNGDTDISLTAEAINYFTTDEKRELAYIDFCGISIYQPVFAFNTDGDGIIWDDAEAGFSLETTDTLILRSL